jgi:3-oxoacyl-[acyl-carrier-protein] synthase-3
MTSIEQSASTKRVGITGTGSCLPDRVMTNRELESIVETTDEWIQTRTGIRERHIAGPDESTSDMAAQAAFRALESARVDPEHVDAILVATCTPDTIFPNTACAVQEKIGAKSAFCMDLSAACSGFLYGMEVGRGLIASGQCRTVLLIGAEKMSTVVDWQDRTTCVLFGDGAGAVVLQTVEGDRGVIASSLGADGSLGNLLGIPGGGSRRPATAESVAERLHFVRMEGNQVFRHAVVCMTEAGRKALEQAHLAPTDVDWVIPHQANMRIVRAIANRAAMPFEKFITNLERVGNLSAASIPVALDEAVRDGRIASGQTVLLVAFGGGFTWGALVLKW